MAIERSEIMNFGEKITSYKERLNHKNFQDFGRAANCSGDWLNNASKMEEIKVVDMHNLINLCDYLGITINQLVVNDEYLLDSDNVTKNVSNSDDIGALLNQIVSYLSNNEDCKLDGVLMNDKAKEVCKDSLGVVRILTKQHL